MIIESSAPTRADLAGGRHRMAKRALVSEHRLPVRRGGVFLEHLHEDTGAAGDKEQEEDRHSELRRLRRDALLRCARPGQERQRCLTDRDREEIDASAKKMLRELNAGIHALDEAEQLRRQAEEAKMR